MARQAVALGVACHTSFQILPGRLAVTQSKELLGVVIAGLKWPSGHHAGVHVAAGAKLVGVVAIGALGFLVVGRNHMEAEVAERVEPAVALAGVGPVTVETLGPGVTRRAGDRRGGGWVGVGRGCGT